MTTDDLLILLIFVIPSCVCILLLRFCPKWAARIAVWGSIPLVLLVEWQFFFTNSLVPVAINSALPQSSLGLVLRALVCLITAVAAVSCLLASRIPSLRRHCSKWVLYLLFSAAYALVFLSGSLVMDALLKDVCYPWEEHPFGVSLASSGLVLFSFLLLWMLGVYALASHLDASQRQLRRRGDAATTKP